MCAVLAGARSYVAIAEWHLHTQLKTLPWRDIAVGHDTRDRGHARTERRTLKVTTVVAGLLFPHASGRPDRAPAPTAQR